MALTPVTEVFSGGIATSRHPALLNAGELQRADDCIYREKDPAIWRAPGRTALTTTAIGTDIRGVGHLSFDGTYVDQFVLLGRRTDGSPTWHSGGDLQYPAFHLYGANFTAVSGLAPTEIGGQGYWSGTVTSTTLEAQIIITNCTISAGTTVTTTNNFTNVKVGAVVSGTGVTAGTRVQSVDSATTLTLDTSATSGTVTLTFTQYPFLVTAPGARIIGTNIGTNVYITAVSNQDGTTGHYRTATLSAAPTGGNAVYNFVTTFGSVYDWQNTGREILDFIQYGARRYYAWDGVGNLQCLEWRARATTTDPTLTSILSTRPVGLRAVEKAPTVALQTSQATGWNLIKGAGRYWILITEIYSPEANIAAALKDPVLRTQIVESAYLATNDATTADNGSQSGAGLPIGVTIVTPATDNILITFPAVTNNGSDGYIATHWGIYIYGPSSEMPSLASMRRCATVQITTMAAGATYPLTDSSLTQTMYPTTVTSTAGRPRFGHDDYMVGAPDDLEGYTKVGGSSKNIPDTAAALLGTYNFVTTGAYASKPIFGVEVQIRGSCNPSGDTSHKAAYWFRVITSGGKASPTFYGQYGSKTNWTNHHGGPMDTLGVAWATTDPPLMQVQIGIHNEGRKDELDIDSVGLKVYYTTTNVDFNGPAYRVVTYRDQVGLTVSDPARLLPPVPSTGDFFMGSLVLNNKSQENQLRYSLPGDPEAWPKPYEITFNTRKKDRITYIKTLGALLFVGMENSVKRVNYLPRETDTDLSGGLAHEDIATNHGIPGPLCAVKFDMPGKGVMIAYASQSGMFLTNAIWTIPLNMDLDWANTIKLSALSTAVLRVYPKEKLLALYYCPAGATHTKNTRVIYFSYQADKIKNEWQMPAIGPCVVSARSACEAYLNGVDYLFTGHEADGLVYVEDSGLSIPTSYRVRLNDDSANGDGKTTANVDVKIVPIIKTRRFFAAGFNRDVCGESMYLLFSSYGANSVTASSTTTVNSTTVTSSAAFGSVVAGMRVLGSGMDPGTIVVSKSDSSTIVISRAANASGTATLTFDTGTIGVTIRGNSIGEVPLGLSVDYVSTLVGDLVHFNRQDIRRGFELQIEKVPLTFSTASDVNGLRFDTATWADLATNMRLHSITYEVEDGGPDNNRNTA